jgi:hypothetical protein
MKLGSGSPTLLHMPTPTSRARPQSIWWNAIIVAVGTASMITQMVFVIQGKNVLTVSGALPPVGTRIIRFFSYFTIESNILAAAVALNLVLSPHRDGRVWRVLRLNALVGISLTGLIYVTLLRPIVNLQGLNKLCDIGVHYVVPIMVVLGWLAFGPRPRIDTRTLLPSLIFPAAYVIYTFAHGAVSHWYPYPFVDVTALGYQVGLRNGAGLCLLLLGFSALYMIVDGWLSPRRSVPTSTPGDDPADRTASGAATRRPQA